jgi:predicted ATPase
MARDEVIELLLPEAPVAAGVSSLKTLVYRLRRHLEPAGLPSPIVLDHGWVTLNPQCAWEIDADQLLRAGDEAGDDVLLLEHAVKLWRGEPLIDDRYEDWAIPVRQALQRTWRELCLRLVKQLRTQRELERAIGWALRLLEADPLDQEALRALLEVLLGAGRRVEARRRLDQFEVRIWNELGVRADEQTRARLTVPGNLPIEATPFIGRETELDAIADTLSLEHVRLLTLTGVDGVGKTRLALRIGARLCERYVDGVFLVTLASLADSRLVASAIATSLRVSVKGSQSLEEAIVASIGNRQMLLILDNCEHVLEGTAVAATLLASCPGLNVLATSRERLHLAIEHGFDVSPFAVPEGDVSVDEAVSYDAVRLFATRAAVASPGFALSQAHVPAVVQICRALDGLPLALELAAARSRELTPQAMVRHLTNPGARPRLSLLTRGFRDLPARQQTLFATIHWSYELLSPEEQQLFRQLSVFSGGCTLEAAEVACLPYGEGSKTLLTTLHSLEEKSLVGRVDEIETRYGLLETIREYALEQLRATGETDTLHERHAAYFLRLVESMDLAGRAGDVWLDRLSVDLDNLRASLSWYTDVGRDEPFLRLATGLFLFWERRNHMPEGIAWLEDALARHSDVPPSLRASALRVQGVLITRLGVDFVRARALLEESLALYQTLGTEDEAIAGTIQNLGLTFKDAGDLKQARSFLEESLARYRALEDGPGIAKLLNNLGLLELDEGHVARAKRLLDEGLTLSHASDDKWMTGLNSLALGAVFREEGNDVSAGSLFRDGLVHLHRIGDKWAIALALRLLASLSAQSGEPLRAIRLFAASVQLLTHINMSLEVEYESDLAEARSQVSESEGRGAWNKGQAMTVEKAVAYALDGGGTRDEFATMRRKTTVKLTRSIE